jgi:hypothetical protein
MKDSISEYEENIKILESKNKELENHLNTSKHEIHNLKELLSSSKSVHTDEEVAGKNELIESLSVHNNILQSTIDRLQFELQESKDRATDLDNKVNECTNEIENLTAVRASRWGFLDENKRASEASLESIAARDSLIKILTIDNDTLKSTLDNTQKELQSLKNQISDMYNTISEQKKEIGNLEYEKSRYIANGITHKEQLESTSKSDIRVKDGIIDSLKSANLSLTEENERLLVFVDKSKLLIQQLDDMKREYKRSHDEWNEERNRLYDELEHKKNNNNNNNSNSISNNQNNEILRNEIVKLNERIHHLDESIEKVQIEKSKAVDDKEHLQSRLEIATTEIDRLSNELMDMQRRNYNRKDESPQSSLSGGDSYNAPPPIRSPKNNDRHVIEFSPRSHTSAKNRKSVLDKHQDSNDSNGDNREDDISKLKEELYKAKTTIGMLEQKIHNDNRGNNSKRLTIDENADKSPYSFHRLSTLNDVPKYTLPKSVALDSNKRITSISKQVPSNIVNLADISRKTNTNNDNKHDILPLIDDIDEILSFSSRQPNPVPKLHRMNRNSSTIAVDLDEEGNALLKALYRQTSRLYDDESIDSAEYRKGNSDGPLFREKDVYVCRKLCEWMVKQVGVVPSRAAVYAVALVQAGAGSLNRLSRMIRKDVSFLSSVGISDDDAEEIIAVLQNINLLGPRSRDGHYDLPQGELVEGYDYVVRSRDVSPVPRVVRRDSIGAASQYGDISPPYSNINGSAIDNDRIARQARLNRLESRAQEASARAQAAAAEAEKIKVAYSSSTRGYVAA